jgi:hypothetical protein
LGDACGGWSAISGSSSRGGSAGGGGRCSHTQPLALLPSARVRLSSTPHHGVLADVKDGLLHLWVAEASGQVGRGQHLQE